MKEVSICKNLSHPHIVKYYHSFIEKSNLYILMEYASNGDLHKLMRKNWQIGMRFSEIELWRWGFEIIIAIAYLHKNQILHWDIKSLNIFLDSHKQIKVGDLGVSKILTSESIFQATKVWTPLYLSPEQIKQTPYDFKVDIWGYGCCLYHLAAMEPPFKGDNLIVLGQSILNDKPGPMSQYSGRFNDFVINYLLDKNPITWPTANEVI